MIFIRLLYLPKKEVGTNPFHRACCNLTMGLNGSSHGLFSYLSVSIYTFFHFSESKVALKKAESTKDDSSKKPVCTTESGASPNLPCIFPFRFNGVTHTTCIWDMAHLTEHKPWCSTLVDEVGHHVGGQSKWGNCGPDCPIPPDTRNETIAVPGRTSFFLSNLY